MKLEVYTKDIELTDELKEYIEKKVESFDRTLGKSDEERVCDFRIGRDGSQEKGLVYFAEARVETPHKAYGAEARGESIQAAIDELKDEILKKIRRNKDKKESLIKKGGRKLKQLLHLN